MTRGQVPRPDHKAMGKYSSDIFPKELVRTCYLSQGILILGHSRWSICSFDPLTSPLGHSRSYEVKFVFLGANFWKNRDRVLGTVPICFFCKDASTDSNMTYLAQHVNSRDLDLRSNSNLDLLRSTCRYIFRRVSTRGTQCCQNYVSGCLSSKVICDKPFLPKRTLFWHFLTSIA